MNPVDNFLTEYSSYSTPNYFKYALFAAIILVLIGCIIFVIYKQQSDPKPEQMVDEQEDGYINK
jgi:hypothetical protein